MDLCCKDSITQASVTLVLCFIRYMSHHNGICDLCSHTHAHTHAYTTHMCVHTYVHTYTSTYTYTYNLLEIWDNGHYESELESLGKLLQTLLHVINMINMHTQLPYTISIRSVIVNLPNSTLITFIGITFTHLTVVIITFLIDHFTSLSKYNLNE